MPRAKSLNFNRLNNELFAADAAVDPILTAANIKTIHVDGSDVPAHEAPLPNKIAAIGKLMAAGDKTEDSAQLIAANGEIAAQKEALEAQLVTANASVSALTQKNAEQESKLNVANASIAKLTTELAEEKNLRVASNAEVSRVTALYSGVNTAVSQHCLDLKCINLTDPDGRLLASTATETQKLEAANRIPVSEKLTAAKGAATSAMARIGIAHADIPANGGKPAATKPGDGLTGLAKVVAIEKAEAAAKASRK